MTSTASLARGRGTSFATGLSEKNGTKRNSNRISCTLCSKRHHLDGCAKFLKKSLVERRDFVGNIGVCFGCYSSEHIVKSGKSGRLCQICNKKHSTSLHNHNWRLEEVKTEGRSSQTSERRREEQESICNMTKAGDVLWAGSTTRTI